VTQHCVPYCNAPQVSVNNATNTESPDLKMQQQYDHLYRCSNSCCQQCFYGDFTLDAKI